MKQSVFWAIEFQLAFSLFCSLYYVVYIWFNKSMFYDVMDVGFSNLLYIFAINFVVWLLKLGRLLPFPLLFTLKVVKFAQGIRL